MHPSDTALCSIGDWFAAQYEKAGSGTFGAVILGDYFLSTSDPGNIKLMLATGCGNFEKGTSNRILKVASLDGTLD